MAAFDKWIDDSHPEMPAAEVARRALDQRLGAVVHFLPLAAHLAHESAEYVHAARVSSRRGVAALELFADFVDKQRRKRMVASLKKIRKSMGPARDLDVYISRLAGSGDAGVVKVAKRLTRKRREAQSEIIDIATPLLMDGRLRRQAKKLIGGIEQEKHRESYGEWACDVFRKKWRTFTKAVPSDKASIEALHELRIAGKRFRYSLELLSCGLPDFVREELYPQVSQLQQQLGEIQDHAVAVGKLGKWRKSAGKKHERNFWSDQQQAEQERLDSTTGSLQQWWKKQRIEEMAKLAERVTCEA